MRLHDTTGRKYNGLFHFKTSKERDKRHVYYSAVLSSNLTSHLTN